jgi:hypothetical protein
VYTDKGSVKVPVTPALFVMSDMGDADEIETVAPGTLAWFTLSWTVIVASVFDGADNG